MANAISVDIANAVTAMIAATTFTGKDVIVERSYADWELALENADTSAQYGDVQQRVDVVAVTTEQRIDLAARGVSRFVIPIDIAVRRKFGVDKQDDDTGRVVISDVDEMCLLTQEIHELFIPNRLTDYLAGVWQETRLLVCPITQHLRLHRQFTSVIRVTFAVDKDIA